MPRSKRLHPAAEWVELSTTAADWKAADPGLLATMLGQLHLIRAFEETVLELAGEGLVHGPAHSSIGQEGGAVGSIVSLRSADAVNGSHRGHHQFLAKAITHVTKGAADPADLVTPEVQTVLQRTLAEILGLAQGYCGGRGGSMHLQWFEAGALGTNAIVGGGVPMAAGNAWAQKHSGTDDLTINYFGDGAANIGSVLESLNLTSAWRLPLCFFIENNLYAVSTTVEEATGEPRLLGSRARLRHPRAGGSTAWTRSPCTSRWSARRRGCARGRARWSSRRSSTASSTRTARSLAAPSATAPRRKRPRGVPATRSTAWQAR